MQIKDIKNIAMDQDKQLNRARLFWKSLTVIFFLTTITGVIAWKVEAYAHQMDAKVIRLEVEKELRSTAQTPTTAPQGGTQSNAVPPSTVETPQTPPIKK